METIYRKEFPILSYHLDPAGRARLTTVANFFQEMAYQHASRLGFGYQDLQKNKTLWVLSRMRIRMVRYPVWDAVVTVETWHRGMDKLFGMRDFRVRDTEGEVLAVAGSAWLIVDMETRRPVRPDSSMLRSNQGAEAVFDKPLGKIGLPESLESLTVRQVVYSDLDIVGHVNNVKYVEWCIDAAFGGVEGAPLIGEFEINFMHEALPGDRIEISGQRLPQGDSHFVGRKKEGGQEIFRARISLDQSTA
jgi:medium-chain acyl-[acyl-carrier-protein] hydrolase